MAFDRSIHICDIDIEKIDTSYFKVIIKLSDGKIIANKVNFNDVTVQQQKGEVIEYGINYTVAKDIIYKIFLKGVCYEDENGVILNVTTEL